jgi:small-conductance mechanosensitive channel
MSNFWLHIVKPKGIYAKWLVLLLLAGIAWLWTQGHFEIAKQYLDTEQLTFEAGEYKISAYEAIKSLLFIIVIFWVTAIIVDFSDTRILKMKKIRIANKVLIQKILQIAIYFLAGLFTLNILGIKLTSLAVLGGALGIGLGFGLQKIASNFVSGLILLMERSLKPGDLIELEDGTFGYVRRSSSRATLIETIDGKEVLVPNEEFIIKQVINWTLSNNKARITLNVGVSYGADIEKARDLVVEAVNEHEKTLKDPAAVCWLDNFGDSSVNFIVYFWIEDVNAGYRSVKSEVLFKIWNKFKENDIEIPFPQRDLHIKTPDILKVHNNAGE